LYGKEISGLIILDYRDRRPIYEQIMERFQELMMSGGLKQDEKLPSVRSLAMELSINPNTIQRAYAELERQGYIYSVKGKGSFVTDNSVLKDSKKQVVLKRQEETALEALLLNVEKEKLKDIIDKIYDRGGKSDD
jgi:GntR family transcriptional regulator